MKHAQGGCWLLLFCAGGSAVDFDFESGLPSGWDTGVTGYAWTRQSGSTPSSGTGPSGAHGGSYYMYTEANGMQPGDVFDLNYNGTACAGGAATVTFWYHMYGSGMGTLRLVDQHGATQWSQSGSQGNAWHEVMVSLPTAGFAFEGVLGSSDYYR